jgi:hypothetical protein
LSEVTYVTGRSDGTSGVHFRALNAKRVSYLLQFVAVNSTRSGLMYLHGHVNPKWSAVRVGTPNEPVGSFSVAIVLISAGTTPHRGKYPSYRVFYMDHMNIRLDIPIADDLRLIVFPI